jgi:hypothetical protein
MSRNLGRQAHRSQQNTTHRKLDSDIADTRSLLDTSAQTTKDLKAQLKELTEKKKEAGKAPRNSQAASNTFNVPIPKIRAGTARADAAGHAAIELAATNVEDVEMQEIVPADIPFVNPTVAPSHHDELSMFQPPAPGDAPTGVLSLSSEIGALCDVEETRNHPGFDLPPLDLDLFNMVLENEQVPEPTAEEVAAYHSLKYLLGK